MVSEGRRLSELRQSNASGKHPLLWRKGSRAERERAALAEQEDAMWRIQLGDNGGEYFGED